MKYQLPTTGNLKALISFCIVVLSMVVFVTYSEAISSKKTDDVTSSVRTVVSPSRAAQITGAPVVSKVVGFGESIPVRDMPRVDTDTSGTNSNYERERTQWEKQFDENDILTHMPDANELEINKARGDIRRAEGSVPQSADGALSPASDINSLSPQTLPTPTVSFEGVSVFDTVPLGQGFLPPDTTGDVGPNHFVQAVNVAFRIWDKTGTPLIPTTSLKTLFSGIPGLCGSNLAGFPAVNYDQLADRWLISKRCNSYLPEHLLVAVSKTGDPTGAYYLYDFMMPNVKQISSPKIGVWPDGYYMVDHQFDKTGRYFRGAGFFALDRAKMLAGDPTASYIYFNSCPEDINCVVAGALPSDLDGFIPPPAGAPNVFGLYTATEWGDPQGDGLRLFDFHADFKTPGNSTFTERVGSPLPVASFDPITAFVKQPAVATSGYLLSLSDTLMFRLAYRNFGTGVESLVLTHTVDTPTEDHVGVRYYQLNRTTPSGPFTIAEQQTFSPDNTSRWTSSGAMNFQGDTAIGFSASSNTVFPSIRYAAKLSTDPPGSGLAQGEQTIIAGGGSQHSETRRWGDYSQMSVDPMDDCSFWYTQEYYQASNTNGWQTRIAKFAPRQCSVSPRGTIQGTVTSCATGLPLAGVSVDATGGFDRFTGESGTYSMMVLPGIYTISPKKLGYSVTPLSGIVVTDGGAATRNFCMMPVPTLIANAVPGVTSGNGLIEPNECNTLNIPVTNNGMATATAVSATLSTTTPGVTITNATSAYPDIAPNGGVQTNVTPFQLSTGNTIACLTNINLTLTVTYAGGGSPSVINLTATVGRPKDPNYVITVSDGTLPSIGTFVQGSRDHLFSNVAAPFPFTLYGKPVVAGDILRVHQSGVIEFKTNDPNPVSLTHALPALEFESTTGVVIPYWADLKMSAPDAGIYTETTGTAPNRTFIIKWRAQFYPVQSLGPINTDIAVLFHENSDDFEYIYTQTATLGFSDPSGVIGVQSLGYGFNYTALYFRAYPGLKLSFTRPGPTCSQGAGSCSVSTPSHTQFDFDGDSKTDISTFRPSAGEWWYRKSSDGGTIATQFGNLSDHITPADFTGDGKTDVAIFRPSTGAWFILRSEDGSFYSFPFGTTGDIPSPADYDGDGKADAAIYRPGSATWYILRSSDGGVTIQQFGVSEDKPAVADYDGDGKADIAIFRPSVGEWWYRRSSNGGVFAVQFGSSTNKAVQGDYTGDGKADIAFWRPSTGEWYVLRSEDLSYYAFPFGATGDIPSPGDYDGDGRFDGTVFRPSSATWYSNRTTAGVLIVGFGLQTDIPVPSAFVP